MRREFTIQRRLIIGALAVLLLADVGLATLSWRLASTPRPTEQQLAQEAQQVKLLKGDIERVELIRKDLPKTVSDFNRFQDSLLPASTGYSTVSAEVDDLARKAGLRMQGMSFHQTALKDRPLSDIEIETQVEGNYTSVVKFLNGLQRSQDVYVVDSLALASQQSQQNNGATPGPERAIRVNVRMHTYFRSEA